MIAARQRLWTRLSRLTLSLPGKQRKNSDIASSRLPRLSWKSTMSTSHASSWVDPPNPDWKIGSKIESLESSVAKEWSKAMENDFKTWIPEKTNPGAMYKIMIGGIIPRPIAFVSSLSAQGVPNLSPFSYFQMISHDPPLIIVSFSRDARPPSSIKKDSCDNILTTKEFTVNIISDPWVEAANWTSVDAPSEIDEWKGSGLTQLESSTVKPPRVKESAFSMECTLHSSQEFTASRDPSRVTTTLIIGLVTRVHVRTDVLTPKADAVDPFKLKPVLRLGGPSYGHLTEAYNITRPKWSEEESKVHDVYPDSVTPAKI